MVKMLLPRRLKQFKEQALTTFYIPFFARTGRLPTPVCRKAIYDRYCVIVTNPPRGQTNRSGSVSCCQAGEAYRANRTDNLPPFLVQPSCR